MSIEQLTAIVPSPASPTEVPAEPDWKEIEKKLGIALPPDYRDFVSTYGSGLLGNFIRVFNPFASSEYLALIPSVERICKVRRELKATEGDEEVPYGIYPDSPGILPWGNDENGNTLYWLTTGHPETWPVIVGEGRGRAWQQFDMPMTSFLAAALSGDIECTIWPADFPNPPEDFVFKAA